MRSPAAPLPPVSLRRILRARFAAIASALLLLAPNARPAEETQTTPPTGGPPLADSALRVGGIFDTSLPGTERRNALRLTFHPHFGDLVRNDVLRVPLGVRYGVTSRWEANAGATTYLSHGLGDLPPGRRLGVSDVRLGTKINLGAVPLPAWETALGVDHVRPVGGPPPEITDGLLHLAPYATFSRHLPSNPSIRVFWSLGLDLVSRSSVEGERLKNQLDDDAALFTGGGVWERGPLHLTLEINYATTRLLGETDRDVVTVRPGVLWELPSRWTPGAGGQWLAGTGLRASSGPDGLTLGASIKIRVDANLKQLLRQWVTTSRAPRRR